MASRRSLQTSVIVLCLLLVLLSQEKYHRSILNKIRGTRFMAERLYISQVINRSTVFNSQRAYNRTRKSDCHSNRVRVNKVLQLIQIGMVAKCVLLCRDIALNPGPLNLRVLQRHKGLSLYYWNIQRLTDPKFEEISTILGPDNGNGTDRKLDILIFTETFCISKLPDSYYSISGYILHRKDRERNLGGDILAYVNENLSAKRRADLESSAMKLCGLKFVHTSLNGQY